MGSFSIVKQIKSLLKEVEHHFPNWIKKLFAFLQWGLSQLEQGRAENKRLAAKAIRRFTWDTSFYSPVLRKPDYISASGKPYDPVRFFRFWIACLKS